MDEHLPRLVLVNPPLDLHAERLIEASRKLRKTLERMAFVELFRTAELGFKKAQTTRKAELNNVYAVRTDLNPEKLPAEVALSAHKSLNFVG